MLYINLRTGHHGIGVVGYNLIKALGALTDVCCLAPGECLPHDVPGPLFERFNRYQPTVRATRHVAYIVFERDLEIRQSNLRTRCSYQALAAASRWGEAAVREAGYQAVTTVHHGVDQRLFSPSKAARRHLRDRFVVFSGGKFEFRKGQDVVIKAFKVFAQRHADVHLVAMWESARMHAETMTSSPHVSFSLGPADYIRDAIRRCLVDSGVDLRQVDLLPSYPHSSLPALYGTCDIGLFPNRCEGATNLVMMEFMACGRPVIATDFSGHRDVLTDANSLKLCAWRPFVLSDGRRHVACWCEPNLDEVVAALEYAYCHRDQMAQIGRTASTSLSTWTWERAAREILELVSAS